MSLEWRFELVLMHILIAKKKRNIKGARLYIIIILADIWRLSNWLSSWLSSSMLVSLCSSSATSPRYSATSFFSTEPCSSFSLLTSTSKPTWRRDPGRPSLKRRQILTTMMLWSRNRGETLNWTSNVTTAIERPPDIQGNYTYSYNICSFKILIFMISFNRNNQCQSFYSVFASIEAIIGLVLQISMFFIWTSM